MNMPDWALAIAYWSHMLATVVWIGGLASLALFVLPAAARTLPASGYAALLEVIQRRFDPLAWFSLLLLVGTGMFQMSANPNYDGLLAIHNRWSLAILLKHVAFFAMSAVSGYMTWGLLPGLRRAALVRARHDGETDPGPGELALRRREQVLLRLNLALAVIVLALTAAARAAS